MSDGEFIRIPIPSYLLGERAYYNLPESEPGLIVDARWTIESRQWLYLVSWGPEEESWHSEVELSKEKQII